MSSERALRIALSVYRGNPLCGGQGVYIRHLSHALVERGHRVTVFAGQPYPDLEDGVELVRLPGLDLYREPDPFRRPRLREIERSADLVELATMWSGGLGEPRTFSVRLRDALRRRRGEFDVLHDDQSLGSALLEVAGEGLPVVASVHHPITIDRRIDLERSSSFAKRLGIRRWYGFSAMQSRVARRLPALLTVSASSKRDIVREMGVAEERIAVVPVGVDPTAWHSDSSVSVIPGRIMTTASSDVPLKGLSILLEALAKVRTDHDDAHLVVIGRLRTESPIEEVIDRLDLGDWVEFVSGESDAELAQRYGECELAVVPSLYEGFSLPAIEAMACGVPLVVTDGGALPEVVGGDDPVAVVVPAGDPGALADAIRDLLDDRDRAGALGERGRALALERYSWGATAAGSEAVYRRVIGKRSC